MRMLILEYRHVPCIKYSRCERCTVNHKVQYVMSFQCRAISNNDRSITDISSATEAIIGMSRDAIETNGGFWTVLPEGYGLLIPSGCLVIETNIENPSTVGTRHEGDEVLQATDGSKINGSLSLDARF